MPSRVERSPFIDWWWTVDRVMLGLVFALMLAGIILCLAGSPPVADRLGLPQFHFVKRQIFFMIPAACVMLLVSFLNPRYVRRAALLVYFGSMALVFAASIVVIALVASALLVVAGLALRARRARMARAKSSDPGLIEAHQVGGHSWVAYGYERRR